jgi:transcriptional regulator of acetoin/glycerol metabolism
MTSPTLPGYRVRAGAGPWREVRSARFVIGSSPRADLVIDAAAPRHLRLELGEDGAVVRALGGPITVGGVPVLVAPVGDAHLTVDDEVVRIERAAPWAPPAAAGAGLDGAAPLRRLAIAALGDGPLLIEGDAGTGRTTAARAIAGPRRIEVDCRGELDALEPRLFGSAMARLGLGESGGAFAEAAGGALVLDAVDELDPSLHTRLIAALDRHPDVRVIAIARDLDGSDLSAPLQDRLAARRTWLPPLAAMSEDILPFARRFAADADPDAELPRDLPRILGARPWRRNLAELRAFMSRLVRL